MPRAMDKRLVMAHERANPATCYMVDIARPDVGQVLRRAADQFLGAPLVSQTPASSLKADPAGAVTLNSATSTLASFTHNDDFATTHIDAAGLTESHVRGLCWLVDPAFGKAVLRKVTVRLKLDLSAFAHTTLTNRVGLADLPPRQRGAGLRAVPVLDVRATPAECREMVAADSESSWNNITHLTVPDAVFDLKGRTSYSALATGRTHRRSITSSCRSIRAKTPNTSGAVIGRRRAPSQALARLAIANGASARGFWPGAGKKT
jgi:hypothetical protein